MHVVLTARKFADRESLLLKIRPMNEEVPNSTLRYALSAWLIAFKNGKETGRIQLFMFVSRDAVRQRVVVMLGRLWSNFTIAGHPQQEQLKAAEDEDFLVTPTLSEFWQRKDSSPEYKRIVGIPTTHPLHAVVDEIPRALSSKFYHSTVRSLFTLPETCLTLGGSSSADTNFPKLYDAFWKERIVLGRNLAFRQLDFYVLRCAYVAGVAPHSRINFHLPTSTRATSDSHWCYADDEFHWDLGRLCEDVIGAATTWYLENSQTLDANKILRVNTERSGQKILGKPFYSSCSTKSSSGSSHNPQISSVDRNK
jgi:hypothetical protein